MSRFVSDLLDLSRLPPPEALRGLDYEAILAERKSRLVALLASAGINYDVESLETDPAIILQETDAYRELLQVAAINDAVASVDGQGAGISPEVRARLERLQGFVNTVDGWYQQMLGVPPEILMRLIRMGSKVVSLLKFVGPKDRGS